MMEQYGQLHNLYNRCRHDFDACATQLETYRKRAADLHDRLTYRGLDIERLTHTNEDLQIQLTKQNDRPVSIAETRDLTLEIKRSFEAWDKRQADVIEGARQLPKNSRTKRRLVVNLRMIYITPRKPWTRRSRNASVWKINWRKRGTNPQSLRQSRANGMANPETVATAQPANLPKTS